MKNPLDEKEVKFDQLKKTLKLTNKIVRYFTEIGDIRPEFVHEHEAYINAVGATVYFLEHLIIEYTDLALEIDQARECGKSQNSTYSRLQ